MVKFKKVIVKHKMILCSIYVSSIVLQFLIIKKQNGEGRKYYLILHNYILLSTRNNKNLKFVTSITKVKQKSTSSKRFYRRRGSNPQPSDGFLIEVRYSTIEPPRLPLF